MKLKISLLLFLMSTCIFGQSKIVNIGILADKVVPQNLPLLEQLKSEIRSVVGTNTTVNFKEVLENGFAFAKAETNYNQLLTSDTDIIIAFGTINAVMLYQKQSYSKPTVVFGNINSDIINLPKEQLTSGKNNINYVITSKSYRNDLNAFVALYPYKKVGIIVDAFQIETLDLAKVFDTYFADTAATYEFLPLNTSGDVDFKDVDAVYLADGGYISVQERRRLIDAINEAELPSFGSYSYTDVESGILATQATNDGINQFFRRMALNVESIINGTNPSDLPLVLTIDNEMTLNFDTAKKIGLPLRYSLLATINFIGGDANNTGVDAYSLLDIMKGVVGDNLTLRATKKNIDVAAQDIKTAKSNFLPNVTANAGAVYIDPRVAEISGGAQPEFSTSAGVGLEQLIYSESANAGIDIQKDLKEVEIANYNASELDALLNASVAYFNALILKTNTNIQNQNLTLTKRNLKIAENNFESGESSKADVLRFRSQLAQNTQALIDASNALRQGYNMINQLLNDDIAKEIDVDNAEIEEGLFKDYKYSELKVLLDDPKLRPVLALFLIEEAKRNAPELKSIGFNKNVLDRNYDLNDWGRFIPTVALAGQYNLAISQSGKGSTVAAGIPTAPDGTYNVGLNLSLPIFQQNQRNINKQTLSIQLEQLELQRESVDLSIEQSINDIILDLISEIANIEISKVSEDNARESLALTQNEYEEGEVPIIQLIDAQNNFLQAQLASATANYNYLLQSMQLERAIGYFFLMNTEEANQDFVRRANEFILNQN